MNAHQLGADGVIINTIVVDSLDVLPGLVDAAIGGSRGDRVVDGVLIPLQTQPTQADYTAAMTALFDATAQSRNYDNRITCALRAGYQGPFQTEGVTFGLWMDTCNALGYTIMAEVMQGQRAQPSVAEFMALLPAMEWPTP